MFTQKLTNVEFFLKLEKLISEKIQRTYKTNWDENAVTQGIAEIFACDFHDLEVTDYYSTYSRIKSCAYINKKGGKNSDEYKFGDLGFLVKIQYKNNIVLEGVSFLEAKRTYPQKTTDVFDHIKFDQTQRIFDNANFSFLLLYDHQSILPKKCVHSYDKTFSVVSPWVVYKYNKNQHYCAAVPLSIVNQLKIKTRELYNCSCFFSEQVVFNFFKGKDLNFDSDLVKLAKGYKESIEGRISEIEPPKYIIASYVSYGSDDVEPDMIDVNQEIYEPINRLR